MIPEISEFSYGFALTNELVGWTPLKAAPIFPSLIEEGKAGGGYDVKLDMPGVALYLQFKRAHSMTRSSANEIKKHKQALQLPFFRFHIVESGLSSQHAMLLELDDGVNLVFYAAPRFHLIEEINAAWQSNTVASRSIFVPPRSIGVLDAKPHHVAYDDHLTLICSKPRPIEALSAQRLIATLHRKLEVEARPLEAMLPEISNRAHVAYERGLARFSASGFQEPLRVTPQIPFPPQVEGRIPRPLGGPKKMLRDLADEAQQKFSAQLVIVQKKSVQ